MPMFVPFFIAGCILVVEFFRYKYFSYILWIILFIFTIFILIYHLTDPVNISL